MAADVPADMADPDDAFSAGDSVAEQLTVIDRRLRHVTDHLADRDAADRLYSIRQDLRNILGRLVLALEVLDTDRAEDHPRTRRLPPLP